MLEALEIFNSIERGQNGFNGAGTLLRSERSPAQKWSGSTGRFRETESRRLESSHHVCGGKRRCWRVAFTPPRSYINAMRTYIHEKLLRRTKVLHHFLDFATMRNIHLATSYLDLAHLPISLTRLDDGARSDQEAQIYGPQDVRPPAATSEFSSSPSP